MANSPHPVLLGPVARELEVRGHEIIITARDHAQTRDLTLSTWPDALLIGSESPASRTAKARAIAGRVLRLRAFAAHMKVDVAASLGSYAQIVAARSLGIPVLTLMDYEFQPANHVSFRLAKLVVVPSVFPARRLTRYGASPSRVVRYDGFKEEFYLDEEDAAPSLDTEDGRSVAVFRPPPEGALYHQHGNAEFELVLAHAIERDDVRVVVLPRVSGQRATYVEMAGVEVPERAVDGLALLRSADVFVGAGGTMCREAALLGVRAYTMFAGRFAAVDAELIRQGILHDLRAGGPAGVDWARRDSQESLRLRERRHQRGVMLRDWLVTRIESLAWRCA